MRLAQTIHAAGASAPGPAPPHTRAVALAARDEAELLSVSARLHQVGVAHVLVREPDPPYAGAAMAIGIPPQPRAALRRLLSRLPLAR